MEENFRFVNLIAEISNFKIHTQSGHYYFTLKDNSSQINAVMWRTRNSLMLFTLVSDNPELFDRWETISRMLLERISQLEAQSR